MKTKTWAECSKLRAEADMKRDLSNFPERLRLRDTQLHDDMGGLGQRIFTTAGQGYPKVEYVRADLVAQLADSSDAAPPRKTIDWSKIVYTEERRKAGKAPILCEFWDTHPLKDTDEISKCLAPLVAYNNDPAERWPFETDQRRWELCRIATGIPYAHDGGECPLPEGVIAKVLRREGTHWESLSKWEKQEKTGWVWEWADLRNEGDIIHFRITGLQEGWSYE